MDFLEGLLLLNPQGTIALAERGLMVQAVLFMLIVAVPVYILLFFFARHYRENNKKAVYKPNWAHAKIDELIWWAIPFEIVLILGALTWSSTHELDPRKPIDGAPPLVIEVVALDWKWLFIYPEQKIATVNYVRMPVNQPVRFEITADAPMNSFWIPALGGQIYAMTGMKTALNLEAQEIGTFSGLSANYSGEGFAHMKFIAEATTQNEFDSWVDEVRSRGGILDEQSYKRLAETNIARDVAYYGNVSDNLFDSIIAKFSTWENTMHAHYP
ncbi:MAG TPA: ubiquinol oxidase subunit II [Candidatus Paceibacterota bacterium]|nr:ubiquinol oxidase subunit II [Candidatus Paceibacterota bacterium]